MKGTEFASKLIVQMILQSQKIVCLGVVNVSIFSINELERLLNLQTAVFLPPSVIPIHYLLLYASIKNESLRLGENKILSSVQNKKMPN